VVLAGGLNEVVLPERSDGALGRALSGEREGNYSVGWGEGAKRNILK